MLTALDINETARKRYCCILIAVERVNDIFDAMNITFAEDKDVYMKPREEKDEVLGV